MSHNDQHEIPGDEFVYNNSRIAYPPSMTMEKQGQLPPMAPLGYPTNVLPENQVPAKTQSRGDGFWKGCCAALCCCCMVEACF
ncbi:cysteine-rich and transmembrane domain-containing protein B-like protein [Tanacetum coccineum]